MNETETTTDQEPASDGGDHRGSRLRTWVVTGMAAIIIFITAPAFAEKIVALAELVGQVSEEGKEESAFAITPLVNYILATFGFICLGSWAAMHGMFTNVEDPKETMLDTERQLDALDNEPDYTQSVMS